jgi:hypothetical protein
MRTVLRALVIAAVGVCGIDYFSHLLFSSPMETAPYFWSKATLYFAFSLVFLASTRRDTHEFRTVLLAGIAVALMWGTYYNILPEFFHYYPFGIALYGLTFLGLGLFGTGLAFGTVHALAFVGGYYASKLIDLK